MSPWRWCSLGCWLIVAPLVHAAIDREQLIARFHESEQGHFRVLPDSEIRLARRLFARMFAGEAQTTAQAWSELGFELLLAKFDQGEYWVLQELPNRREGRGWFVIARHGGAYLLQVPHRRDDLQTGEIGLALMLSGRFAGGAWNTIPRDQVDLAHTEPSYLSAFTEAWAETRSSQDSSAWSVQLHGFDARRHPDVTAKIVLSSGLPKAPKALHRYRSCLAKQLRREVAIYPEQGRGLGGTRNVLGRLLRHEYPRLRFAHLEIAADLRRELASDFEFARLLAECLP